MEELHGEPQEVVRRIATAAIEGGLNDKEYLDFVRLVAGESGRFPQLAQAFLENFDQAQHRSTHGLFRGANPN